MGTGVKTTTEIDAADIIEELRWKLARAVELKTGAEKQAEYFMLQRMRLEQQMDAVRKQVWKARDHLGIAVKFVQHEQLVAAIVTLDGLIK